MDLDFESAVDGVAVSLVSLILLFILQGFSKVVGRFPGLSPRFVLSI